MITVHEYQESTEEKTFLLNAFNSKDVKLFWSLKSKKYDSAEQIIKMLSVQHGNYKLFFGYEEGQVGSFYILQSISQANKRAELMAYIDPSRRKGIHTFTSWVLVLHEIQKLEIEQLFAKVFDHNFDSLLTAQKIGFTICGIFPDYIYNEGKTHNIVMLHRTSNFSQLESSWYQKYQLRYKNN